MYQKLIQLSSLVSSTLVSNLATECLAIELETKSNSEAFDEGNQ